MATSIQRAVIPRRVTAPKAPLPEQEHRGRLFVGLYASLVVLATLAFGALVLFVRGEDVLNAFDGPVARAIQGVHVPVLSWLLVHTSDLGFTPGSFICMALVILPLFALRLRLEAVVILLSTAISGGLATLVKDLVERARPNVGFVHVAAYLHSYSFPSGHVVFATVLFGLAFWVIWIAWQNSWLRNVVLVGLALLIPLMGFSRIYLGEHWPTDVIGANCLASLWVAGTIELLLALKPRLNAWWQGRPHRRIWTAL